MWTLVKGVMTWVGIGAAAGEAAEWAADRFLDNDNPVRQTLDNTVGKANSAAVAGAESVLGLDKLKPMLIGWISKLDNFFGGDHFLGKIIAEFLPDSLLNPEDRSKLKGTTVNEEWTANYMQGFAKFDNWDKLEKSNSWDSKTPEVEWAKTAKDQGFTGATPLDVLKQAHWAASPPMSLKNSEQLHYLESLPQVKAAGGVEPFVKAQIAHGDVSNGNELTEMLKREVNATPPAPAAAVGGFVGGQVFPNAGDQTFKVQPPAPVKLAVEEKPSNASSDPAKLVARDAPPIDVNARRAPEKKAEIKAPVAPTSATAVSISARLVKAADARDHLNKNTHIDIVTQDIRYTNETGSQFTVRETSEQQLGPDGKPIRELGAKEEIKGGVFHQTVVIAATGEFAKAAAAPPIADLQNQGFVFRDAPGNGRPSGRLYREKLSSESIAIQGNVQLGEQHYKGKTQVVENDKFVTPAGEQVKVSTLTKNGSDGQISDVRVKLGHTQVDARGTFAKAPVI